MGVEVKKLGEREMIVMSEGAEVKIVEVRLVGVCVRQVRVRDTS